MPNFKYDYTFLEMKGIVKPKIIGRTDIVVNGVAKSKQVVQFTCVLVDESGKEHYRQHIIMKHAKRV